jgi:hypothetical protein
MVTSNNNPLNKFPFKLVRNLGIFVFIAIFLRPFTIVTAGQRGVVMKFGKVEDYILDEGLHPIIPMITSVKKISVRVEKIVSKLRLLLKTYKKLIQNSLLTGTLIPYLSTKSISN